MAQIYVNSVDGSDSDNGSTWALAKATLGGADAIDAAGDQINLASAHSESIVANVTFGLAGSSTAPTKVLSVSTAAEPPTSLAAGAAVTTTGSYSIYFNGNFYAHGITFTVGSGSSSGVLMYVANVNGNYMQTFDSCALRIASVSGVAGIMVGSGGNIPGNLIHFKNTTVRFSHSGSGLELYTPLVWQGGGIESGGTSPSTLIEAIGGLSTGRGGELLAENLDLTNGSTTMNLVGTIGHNCAAVFRNIRLPASWTGSLVGSTQERGCSVKMHNYSIGTTEYMMWEQYWNGSIKSDTAHYRSGGASDGTTAHCWLMATTANAAFPNVTLDSPEIVRWNDTTGSAINVTVEIAQEGGSNLDNDEIWVEINYLGNSGVWQGALDDDDRCGIIATPAAQTTSSETWTGFTTPTRQKLEATFTPQEKGFIYARVRLAKPSTSVYVCPKLTVS